MAYVRSHDEIRDSGCEIRQSRIEIRQRPILWRYERSDKRSVDALVAARAHGLTNLESRFPRLEWQQHTPARPAAFESRLHDLHDRGGLIRRHGHRRTTLDALLHAFVVRRPATALGCDCLHFASRTLSQLP